MISLETYKKICESLGLVVKNPPIDGGAYMAVATNPITDKEASISYFVETNESNDDCNAIITIYLPPGCSMFSLDYKDSRYYASSCSEEELTAKLKTTLDALEYIKGVCRGNYITLKQVYMLYSQFEESVGNQGFYMSDLSIKQLIEILETRRIDYINENKNNHSK